MSTDLPIADLVRALQAAEEALRMRDEFLRLFGHEVRSPLTAVQLQVDALAMVARQGASADEIEQRARKVRRSTQRLAWAVEEMVDLGKAVGGRFALHVESADLVVVAGRALDRLADELARSGCNAQLKAPAPVIGSWDVARLEHAIGSLVLAAMKSGGGQPIDIDIDIDIDRAAGDGAAGALVEVRDRGPGLPVAESALVFEVFDRLLVSLPPGSPIVGLWLARAVAEAHGGGLALGPGLGRLHLPKTGRAEPGLIGGGSGPP